MQDEYNRFIYCFQRITSFLELSIKQFTVVIVVLHSIKIVQVFLHVWHSQFNSLLSLFNELIHKCLKILTSKGSKHKEPHFMLVSLRHQDMMGSLFTENMTQRLQEQLKVTLSDSCSFMKLEASKRDVNLQTKGVIKLMEDFLDHYPPGISGPRQPFQHLFPLMRSCSSMPFGHLSFFFKINLMIL